MRLGVLNNLHAGRNLRLRDDMRQLVHRHRDVVYVETDGAADVTEALATFAHREVDLVAVSGGDGTLQHFLTAMLDHGVPRLPLVAPLRGGRTNMSALDLGCERGPLRAVGRLAAACENGGVGRYTVERPVLRIDLGTEGVRYGMFCGLGVLHRATELVHRIFPPGRGQGTVGAGVLTGLLVARAAFRPASGLLTPDPMAIRLDGESLPHERFQLTMMTTLDRFVLRLRPFWGREPAPVRVTAIAHPAERVARAALGVLRGRPRPHVRPETGYTSRNVHVAEFVVDCGITIDGELFAPAPGRRLRVEADHRVRFVRA